MSVSLPGTGKTGDLESPLDRCRVCAGPVDLALTVREMIIGTCDTFDYYECRRCGCLQIASIPEDLDRYYADSYYTRHQHVRFGNSMAPIGLRRSWTRFRLRESNLARVISGRRYARFEWFRRTRTGLRDAILDVGCGSGRLLGRLDAAGFERLTGIDIRLDPMLDRTRDGTSPNFERVSVEDHRGRYQLVMSHHSFEHVEDPARGFAAFGRLVEPGGHLLLRLPLADRWARRRYGADWVQLDAPRHLHLHTRRSIEILAQRNGFRLAHVADDSGPFQIWGSELYQRGISLRQVGRGGRGDLSWMDRVAARARAHGLSRREQGDQACFYLQRVVD